MAAKISSFNKVPVKCDASECKQLIQQVKATCLMFVKVINAMFSDDLQKEPLTTILNAINVKTEVRTSDLLGKHVLITQVPNLY